VGQGGLRLADGKAIEREGCGVQIEIGSAGHGLTTPIILGDPGTETEALTGAVTLDWSSSPWLPIPIARRLVPVEGP